MKIDHCTMCLDISPDCAFIRVAMFYRGVIPTGSEPLLTVDVLDVPDEAVSRLTGCGLVRPRP
jgi:hypothetical protein